MLEVAVKAYTDEVSSSVTVTTCPITSTKYEDGTTKVVTELTTSTITVTSCLDCEGVITIPGPTGHEYTTTEVLVTYTTLCPVTETITEPGHSKYICTSRAWLVEVGDRRDQISHNLRRRQDPHLVNFETNISQPTQRQKPLLLLWLQVSLVSSVLAISH